MPEYLLSVWHDDDYEVDFDGDEMQRVVDQVDTFNDELRTAGAWIYGGGLQPASSATVLRAGADDVSTTEGPYAGTKAQMGGFWVIEAADLDEALTWARKATIACEGPVELRPFQEE